MESFTQRFASFIICVTSLAFSQLALAQNSPQDYLNAHNAAGRRQVGVDPIAWDDGVAAYPTNYANQRAGDCTLEHSGGPYGENLFGGSGADFMATDAVNSWVSESQYYDYISNTCAGGQVCGHYTQVVWRSSGCLGCGRVKCGDGGIFITCNRRSELVGQREPVLRLQQQHMCRRASVRALHSGGVAQFRPPRVRQGEMRRWRHLHHMQ